MANKICVNGMNMNSFEKPKRRKMNDDVDSELPYGTSNAFKEVFEIALWVF